MISHSSANDIAALPPGVKLTTLDDGLVIIVRGSPLLLFGASDGFCRSHKPIASHPVTC